MRIQILQPLRFIIIDKTMFIRVLNKSIGTDTRQKDALGEDTLLIYNDENNIINIELESAIEPSNSEIESELEVNEKLREIALDLDLIYIRTMDISYLNYCNSYN